MIHSPEAIQYLFDLVSGSNTSAIPEVPLETTLKIAKANSLLLAAGDALDDFNLPEEYQTSYQEFKLLERNSISVMHTLLEQCQVHQLPILTIKSFLPFPYADSNIDIVAIDSEAIEQYRKLIKRLGFLQYPNLADIREPYKEMYYHSKHGKTDKTYPKLHLHRSISWNGVVYIDPYQVWSRRRIWQVGNVDIPIPSPEDELLIMAAHAIFENKYITLSELIYLSLLTESKLNWDYIVETAHHRFWFDALRVFLSIACSLGNSLRINMQVEIAVPEHENYSSISLPMLIPLTETLGPALLKLRQDVQHGHLHELPRQLFTYFFVDCLWMYYKAQRKIAKV